MMVQLARYVDTNLDLTVTLTHDADDAQQYRVTTQVGVNLHVEEFSDAPTAFIRVGVLIFSVENDLWLIHNAAEPSTNQHWRAEVLRLLLSSVSTEREFQGFDWRAFPV